MAKRSPVCDYCGKSAKQVGRLVESPPVREDSSCGRPPGSSVHICGACIDVCQVMVKSRAKLSSSKPDAVPSPREIVAYLDQYVVGQDRAKRTLAVAVASHYKRLVDAAEPSSGELADTTIEKSNILLIGPTGSGKTLLAKTLAKILNVPFAIGDATTLTEAGYVGEDVENLILKLLRNADFDVARAEMGIIYLDEVDKIGRTTSNVSITRDVSGEGVQQSLLKMLEGTVCNVPTTGGRKHPEQQTVQVDTTNILFVVGGTFVGLEDIVRKRIGKRRVGFGGSDTQQVSVTNQVTEDDLVQFGLIPELVGRLPVITPLDGLDEAALLRVLSEPKDALVKQYRKLFLFDGVDVKFSPEALSEIARRASAKGTGARGLRSVMEGFMTDLLFAVPDNPASFVEVTPGVVGGDPAVFTAREKS